MIVLENEDITKRGKEKARSHPTNTLTAGVSACAVEFSQKMLYLLQNICRSKRMIAGVNFLTFELIQYLRRIFRFPRFEVFNFLPLISSIFASPFSQARDRFSPNANNFPTSKNGMCESNIFQQKPGFPSSESTIEQFIQYAR